jgi:hypothetical protein
MHTQQTHSEPSEWDVIFGTGKVNVGTGVTLFDEYDDDVQHVVSESDHKFAADLGFSFLSGSLGNDYTTTVQQEVDELLQNGSLEGNSELDQEKLFKDLLENIFVNKEGLAAASWVLQSFNSGRKGTLLSHPIGFGEVKNNAIRETKGYALTLFLR